MRLTLLLLSALSTPLLLAEQVGPWDLSALKSQVPEVKWLRQDQPIHSLTYAGEKYLGQDTEVFAFYASPLTLGAKPGAKFPGIVLIHGGGGTAFADWVHLWASRGYAAIAMDLNGSRPPEAEFDPKTGMALGNGHRGERKRLAKGGPPHGHPEKFQFVLTPDTSDDWPFHAAASVMRAHSLLRSLPGVDAEHTAVTGISWGGYTTCLVASLDDRFKAAVPVYGCGFLHEGESVQKPSIDKLDSEHRALWVKEYDPGSLLPRCRVPIFFVNGTNDVHYVLDSYMKSYHAVPGEKQIRIQVMMAHGHPPGWAPAEIGAFVDSKCLPNGTKVPGSEVTTAHPLPTLSTLEAKGDLLVCKAALVNSQAVSAELHYTEDIGPRSKRQWKSLPAKLQVESLNGSGQSFSVSSRIEAPQPPPGANTWFLSVKDSLGMMVTSEVQFRP
jgi:dienelactone hydrolase